jgi:hypothetical protein
MAQSQQRVGVTMVAGTRIAVTHRGGDTAGDTRPLCRLATLEAGEFKAQFRRGGMAEWSMAVVLKTDHADLANSQISP